jgi:hypothetical protein
MENSGKSCDAMALEPSYHVVNPTVCCIATGFIRNELDDNNLLRLLEKWQCIAHRTSRFARVPPTDHGKL